MRKALTLLTIAFVSSAFAARTVSISSTTDTSVTLTCGTGDGKSYQLYVGYGAADGGKTTSAWSTFAKVADIADSTTSYSYTLPEGWGTTVKAIRFFLVEPQGRAITSEWWRFTFTKSAYSPTQFALGDLRLWSDASAATDQANGIVLQSTQSAPALNQGCAFTSMALTSTNFPGQANLWSLNNCFDNEKYNAIHSYLSTTLSASPQSITLRLASGKNSVTCYSMISSYIQWNYHPDSWYVEVSDDGTNWTKIDARAGQAETATMYTGNPYTPNVAVVASQTATFETASAASPWYVSPRVVTAVATGYAGTTAPHYMNKSADDKYLAIPLNYTVDAPIQLYRIPDLVSHGATAANLAQAQVSTTMLGTFARPKGCAVSSSWVLPGNADNHSYSALSTSSTVSWATGSTALSLSLQDGVIADGLDFSSDGTSLYANDLSTRNVIRRYTVGTLTQGATLTQERSFTSALTRLRNLSVYKIAGKDMLYFGEGDSSAATAGKVYVVDTTAGSWAESLLVDTGHAGDIMNVKISNSATDEPKLYVAFDDGTLLIYGLNADGMSGATQVKEVSPDQTAALCGLSSKPATMKFRNFEVTDDASYAFFLYGTNGDAGNPDGVTKFTVVSSIPDRYVVEKGSPSTITASQTVDAVYLHDNLTVDSGAKLTIGAGGIIKTGINPGESPVLTVDGGASIVANSTVHTTVGEGGGSGSILIKGGSAVELFNLTVSPELGCDDDEFALLTVQSGARVTMLEWRNRNASVAAKMVFDGGGIRPTTFDAKPFGTVAGSKWVLEGVNGNDILIGSMGMQRLYWRDGDGVVETRGNSNVIVYDNAGNSTFSGTVYLNAGPGYAVWNHSGDFIASNQVDIIATMGGYDVLPYGDGTGGVVFRSGLGEATAEHRGQLNMGSNKLTVNSLDTEIAKATLNDTGSQLTVYAKNGDSNTIKGAFANGSTAIVKKGTGTVSVETGSQQWTSVTVNEGTLRFFDADSSILAKVNAITVGSGAQMQVDTQQLRANSVAGAGAVSEVNGGRLIYGFGASSASDSVVYDSINTAFNSVVKGGSNRAVMQLASTLSTEEFFVDAGSVVFAGRTITNDWWRMVFTGNVYSGNYNVQLGDLRFYSSTACSENVSQGLTPGSGTDASALAKGKVITTFVTSTTKPAGQSCNLWDIRNAFDNSEYNAVWAPSTTSLASSPKSITWRLAEGRNRVQCYKVISSYITWYLHPNAWRVETSPNGSNWTVVDTRSGQQSSTGGVSLGGTSPYTIKGYVTAGAAGIAASAKLSVASGASIDFANVDGGQTITKIEVDCANGGGTISNFMVGESGVLYLKNVASANKLNNYEVPVTLEGVTAGANFKNWTVFVNGSLNGYRRASWIGGKLVFLPAGTCIILR